MLDEADGPMNFTQMVTLFAAKMAGGTDDDETILKSFEAFEINGQIDAEAFRHSLMTFGNKFSASEVDDAFGESLRLNIGEPQRFLIKSETLYNLNILIPNDRLNRVIRLMMNHIIQWRHIFTTQGLHEDIDRCRILNLICLIAFGHNDVWVFSH